MIDPNEPSSADSPHGERDNPHHQDMNESVRRPYGDAGNLYEIPRVRPEDPPLRRWWTDDEPQQGGNSSQNS